MVDSDEQANYLRLFAATNIENGIEPENNKTMKERTKSFRPKKIYRPT